MQICDDQMKMRCTKCGANVRFKRRALKVVIDSKQVFYACTAAVEALIAETHSPGQVVIDHRKN